MRYFLILVCLLFFAPRSQAQTVIDNKVAEFFLEKNEELKVLKKDVVVLEGEVNNLTNQLNIALKEGAIRAQDVLIYKDKITEKDLQLMLKNGEVKRMEREIRRQKFQKILAYGVAGFVVLLTLIYGQK